MTYLHHLCDGVFVGGEQSQSLLDELGAAEAALAVVFAFTLQVLLGMMLRIAMLVLLVLLLALRQLAAAV